MESRVIVDRFHLESRRKRFCSYRLIKKRGECVRKNTWVMRLWRQGQKETQKLRGRKDRDRWLVVTRNMNPPFA